MRSKFFVRALKRGDYDPLCEYCEHDTSEDRLSCLECDGWNHNSPRWVRDGITYFWGRRGDAKPWPKSRTLRPMDVVPCGWRGDGTVSFYRWRPAAEVRRMHSEYSRRRKKR